MAFTVNDYQDLINLLEEHPEWRTDLRRMLLADDILELPRITRELAEAQQAAVARLDRLDQTVAELVEAQTRANDRLDRLDQTVAELAERLNQLEQTVAQLAKRLDELTTVVARLASTQEIMAGHIGDLRGWRIEANFREHPYAYLGLVMRKARSMLADDLPEVERARDDGRLTDKEWSDLLVTDAIIRGRIGSQSAMRDVYLALEASAVVDRTDVTRAAERAAILQKVGLNAIPAVGGLSILPEAEQLARQLKVAVSADGALTYWPEAG